MQREDLIIPLVTNKYVLDCGGVDHSSTEQKLASGEWLHAIICQHAKSCVGVDILKDRVEAINRAGLYIFQVANVETLPFENEFDVVIAGEMIEHLYNAGSFLDSAWKALKSDGILIITTPNHHALSRIMYSVIANREVCHKEHTCWYSRQTLTYIVTRHGFVLKGIYFVNRRARHRFVEWFRALICRVRPCLSETLVLVALKTENQSKYDDKW